MRKNSSAQIDDASKAIEAITKHLSKVKTVMLAGKTVATSDVAAALQARIDALRAAQSARGAWLAACSNEKAEQANSDVLLRNFFLTVKAMFDTQPDVLADFGIVPRKRATPTAQTKAAAVVKSTATRAARLTVGPKAKAKIKAPAASVNAKASESNGSSTPSAPK